MTKGQYELLVTLLDRGWVVKEQNSKWVTLVPGDRLQTPQATTRVMGTVEHR